MRSLHSESYQVGSSAWRCLSEAIFGVGEAREAQTLTSHLRRTYNETRLILAVLQRIEVLAFFDQGEKLASSFCTACQPPR
jgi:hypothetical protein